MKCSPSLRLSGSLLLYLTLGAFLAQANAAEAPSLSCFISTGDNHWLGEALPIDSPATIDATFDLLARLGVKRLFWRGLEEATWLETMHVRPENCRYASAFQWFKELDEAVHPDKLAVEAGHRRGMEVWGVGTLVDWQCQADAPGFGDFPSGYESRLRLEHPEWVPIDKSGLLKQGGPIEFAYPEARKALVDLHMKFVRRDGYDGVMFVTYAENYSMRFQDEFGYNDPIVKEFKRRTGVDIRTQPFSRSASRYDWYNLRGEYLTQYLRELKDQLKADGKKLGLFINPQQPHFTQPWNVPELMLTAGHIYVDLDTYVRDGIVDHLSIWGYCHPTIQTRTIHNLQWMTRGTPTTVSVMSSSPFSERAANFAKEGVPTCITLNEDATYLLRSNIPEQPVSALQSSDSVLRMRVLAQIIDGKTKASTEAVAPLTHDTNPIVRRLALGALGKLHDPAAVTIIEAGLEDRENAVRCSAAAALRDNNRPESAAKMLAAVDRYPTHPLREMVFHTMPRIKPAPREVLSEAALHHANPDVRSTAMRSLVFVQDQSLVPVFTQGLKDSDRFTRFAAAEGLGNIVHSAEAAEVLLAALEHEDPTVSDRAATSLGVVIARNDRETAPLRPRILAGLKALYAKLGDGCRRADADWGYRPVGNVLLKLGDEGEAVLRGFMGQEKDRQLALEAWKSLYIRKDSKSFSEVTEEENEEAFRHLPVFLKTGATTDRTDKTTPAATAQSGRQLYVNPETGKDTADGFAAEVKGGSGPFKTIARAVKLSQAGDTIHLAKMVYHEQVGFYGVKSGEAGRPITVDGHGATISGCIPLDPTEWKQVSSGLYRNDTLFAKYLHSKWEFVARFSFIFDGKLVRMGHSVKAPKVEWKAPCLLHEGEWTYQQADHDAYFIKIDPAKKLEDYHIEEPVMVSGVQVDGNISHVVFKNLTVTHVVNDGFALRSSPVGAKVRDIVYQNIRAIDACDDGFSAHDDCEVRIEGFYCEGCSTAIATAGHSVNDRVVTKNIHGVDLLFGQGEHLVTNSQIEAHGGNGGVAVETWNKQPGWDFCTLTLDHVQITGPSGPVTRSNLAYATGAKAKLALRHCALERVNLAAQKGATLEVEDSEIRGGGGYGIVVDKVGHWEANRNRYGMGSIDLGGIRYISATFGDYQKASGQDGRSEWTEGGTAVGASTSKK